MRSKQAQAMSARFSWFEGLLGKPWQKELRRIAHAPPGSAEVFSAVNRLMSRNLKYDAIRLLYEMEMYREAGDILRAIGSSGEAARMYVLGRNWEQAEFCFSAVLDWKNAARSARAARKFARAGELFEKAENPVAAARCYRRVRNWRRAAALFESGEKFSDAVYCWTAWAHSNQAADYAKLTDEDLSTIARVLAKTGVEPTLFNILEQNECLDLLVLELLRNSRLPVAVEIYSQRPAGLRQSLCELVANNQNSTQAAIEMFVAAKDPLGAAILFERTDRPYDAAEYYESAGDLQAAYACALKTEWWEKISTLKTRMNPVLSSVDTSRPTIPPPPIGSADFSLMSVPKQIPITEFSAFELTGSSTEMSPAFVESRFFNQLSQEDRKSLWEIGQIGTFEPGETVVDYDSLPQGTFTLLLGELTIYRRIGGQEKVVDRISAGENFGESWLMLGLRSEVRIVASKQAHLHLLDRQGFERSIESDSGVNARVVSQVAQAVCFHLLKRFGVSYALPETAA